MKWAFWRADEDRQSGGGFTDTIVAAIEASASQAAANVSSTAAVEAVAGLLSRAFAGAEVQGPGWVRDACNPVWLAQVGRSLVREGASLSVVDMDGGGVVELVPAAFWNFENLDPGRTEADRESSWRARVSTYGPSTSSTRLLPRDQLVFVRWGTSPGTRYRGQGPTSWAALTAKLQGEVERSLGDEAAGPLAQLLPQPEDPGNAEGDADIFGPLKATIAAARGRALLLETTAGGGGRGRTDAPARDWVASRLGPAPPAPLVTAANAAWDRMLAAFGMPSAVFHGGDGTGAREALRVWHQLTVMPLARILSYELTQRLETEINLTFDPYARDQVSRASVASKLAGIEGMTAETALQIAGLMSGAP